MPKDTHCKVSYLNMYHASLYSFTVSDLHHRGQAYYFIICSFVTMFISVLNMLLNLNRVPDIDLALETENVVL